MTDSPFDPSLTQFVNPVPVVEVVEEPVTEKVVETVDVTDKAKLLKAVQNTLTAHGGMESNIGHNHPYWQWLNLLRGL